MSAGRDGCCNPGAASAAPAAPPGKACGCGGPEPARFAPGGIENPGVLDALVWDEKAGRVILAMFERRPWDGGEHQLWQLQEKLNAYVSFAVDGELAEAYPDLAGKPLSIHLRSLYEPSDAALDLLARVREQLKFLEIEIEVWDLGDGRGAIPG